ncbi:hypothetical protein CGRA01v4_03842 [Colletotrichum graminicola]|nr:hypothetical protein CGRA01v4_03842 [Colletotrichum graminicola]
MYVSLQLETCSSSSHRARVVIYMPPSKQSSPSPPNKAAGTTQRPQRRTKLALSRPLSPFHLLPSRPRSLHTQPTCSPGSFCNKPPALPRQVRDASNLVSASVYLVHLVNLLFLLPFSSPFALTQRLFESARLFPFRASTKQGPISTRLPSSAAAPPPPPPNLHAKAIVYLTHLYTLVPCVHSRCKD